MRTCERTVYVRRAPLEEAPAKLDCLTTVWWVYKKAIGHEIDLDFIGNMPGALHEKGWELIEIDEKGLRDGDIVFAKNKRAKRLVTHAAVVAGEKLFHCLPKKGCASIDVDRFLRDYEQPSGPELLRYKDVRA